jgi:hypothetical protein
MGPNNSQSCWAWRFPKRFFRYHSPTKKALRVEEQRRRQLFVEGAVIVQGLSVEANALRCDGVGVGSTVAADLGRLSLEIHE